MSDQSETQPDKPFLKVGFIASAVVVLTIVVLGVVLAVQGAQRPQAVPPPSAPTTTSEPTAASTDSPTAPPTSKDPNASVCGLKGSETEGRLSSAPKADWAYEGTTAYPTSAEYGPAKTADEGYRYCFQRTPEGAVFAAANAVAQGTNAAGAGSWLEYFVAEGPHRAAFLSSGPGQGTTGARVAIAGFRLLSYDGTTARVDLGVEGAAQGQTVLLSMVYELEWQDGDWKLTVVDPRNPINAASVPSLDGYIPWRG